MDEIWKDVQNYPGYQVSNLGRVMTFKNTHSVISDKGRLMVNYTRGGYCGVKLTNNKDDSNNHYVHILIAEAFIPAYKEYNNVLFINGDTLDCRLDNLLVIEFDKVYSNGEVWRNVPGYEGKYFVSNIGRVISNVGNTKLLIPKVTPKGYHMVTLSNDKVETKGFPVHRLMGLAFILNPENKATINHKNGIKIWNTLDNIEWATYTENNQHALDTGLRKPSRPMLGRFGKDNPRSKKIVQLTMNNEVVRIFDCITDVQRELGINHGHISSCANGRYGRRSCGGFRWEYE